MQLISSIFIVLGFVLFIDSLFDKWNVWDLIDEIGRESNSIFIFKLTRCEFCLTFHLSWFVTLIYGVADKFEWSLLVVPFVVSGIISKFIKNGL